MEFAHTHAGLSFKISMSQNLDCCLLTRNNFEFHWPEAEFHNNNGSAYFLPIWRDRVPPFRAASCWSALTELIFIPHTLSPYGLYTCDWRNCFRLLIGVITVVLRRYLNELRSLRLTLSKLGHRCKIPEKLVRFIARNNVLQLIPFMEENV